MPSSITPLAISIALALAMAVASISAVGRAIAQSTVEPTQAISQNGLSNRPESPVSETEFGLGDHQQLRRIFLDSSHRQPR